MPVVGLATPKADHQIAVSVQTGGEGTDGGGLTGADLAGDQAAAAFAHQISQACGEFLLAGGGEQLVGLDSLRERRTGEAVIFLKHAGQSFAEVASAGSKRANSRRPSSRRCCS